MKRVAFAALALGACEPKPAPGEAIADVCRVDRSGQTVTASGYLQVPPLVVGCHEKDCRLPSTMTPLPQPKESRSLASPNVVPFEEVPFELRDASGRRIAKRDFVRVTGALTTREHDGKTECEMRVTTLERL